MNITPPAFGVNFDNIKQIVIWQIPSNLEVPFKCMINIMTCCPQVFMQMVGRAARQEDEQANVDVFLSTPHYHSLINKINRNEDPEFSRIERISLTWLYNALQPGKCTWKHLLSYFNEHVNDDWTCETKCGNCLGNGSNQNNEICKHPSLNTALKTINLAQNIYKTTLYNLLLSTPSSMEKVATEIQNIFLDCKDTTFKKLNTQQQCYEFIAGMQEAGLIKMEITQTERSPVLRLTNKGLSIMEELSRKNTTEDVYDCKLPTLEMMKERPFPPTDFSMPSEEDLKTIHAAEEMTDDLFEICLRIPILKGLVVLDMEETNRIICVPRAIIAEIWCNEHKTSKAGYAAALGPFHRYPNYISWGVYTRWKSVNTFKDSLVGFHIKWSCSHRTFGCAVQKVWRTIYEERHNGEDHVVIEEVYDTIGTDKEIRLNRHLHPCGSKVQNRERKSKSDVCCVFNRAVIAEPFCNLMTDEEELPQKSISQPVFSFMQQLDEKYSTDPMKAQLNSTVTYGKARNMQHSIALSKRPWLADSTNVSSMSRFNRVERLKDYIDKQEHKHRIDLCPCYIGTMTLHTTDVFTVICTDLFGVSLFTLATKKKNSVISIDGTGEDNTVPLFMITL